MRRHPIAITAVVALLIAVVGVVLLHTDDTDANDSATPVADDFNAQRSFSNLTGPGDIEVTTLFAFSGPDGQRIAVEPRAKCGSSLNGRHYEIRAGAYGYIRGTLSVCRADPEVEFDVFSVAPNNFRVAGAIWRGGQVVCDHRPGDRHYVCAVSPTRVTIIYKP